jgi:hypothetical protein
MCCSAAARSLGLVRDLHAKPAYNLIRQLTAFR